MPAPTSRFARFLRPGAIMMAFGSVLILAGVVQTTSSTNGGNQSCPSGTSLIAKFEYGFHGYDFDSPSGNEHVVTLSHESADGAWWASTKPISAIIVKGGSASVLYSIAPPQVTGSFSNSGLPDVGHGNKPDVSNVQFCGPNTPVTTTTHAATTTTHAPTTTSTSPSTTSTTVAPTSSTCGQCATTTTAAPVTTTTTCHQCESTTTEHSTGTTCNCTTTTVHAPTTTCHCSTTTTQPHETTTTAAEGTTTTVGETTTTVSGSTTSSTEVSGSTIHITTTTRSGVSGQGTSTSFGPTVSSTSVFTGDSGTNLPFTGSSSTPLIVIGLVLLATGLTLTLSQARRRERTTS
jgi:hypothetical protein